MARERERDTYEENDVVDTVDVFWREMRLDGTHDKRANLWLNGAFPHLVEVDTAEVAERK